MARITARRRRELRDSYTRARAVETFAALGSVRELARRGTITHEEAAKREHRILFHAFNRERARGRADARKEHQ